MDISHVPLWIGFSIFVISALAIDTFFLKERFPHPNQSIKVALLWTVVWVMSALIFNAILWEYLYHTDGRLIANEKALDFFTGYIIEKSLSIDNLFAFYLVFHELRIPVKHQQRVFTYGIWSAIVLRLILILFLSYLISIFHGLLYVMGLFLLLTGLKMLLPVRKNKKDIVDNKILNFLKHRFRITHDYPDQAFFLKRKKMWFVTPLFLALIMIEFSDLIFAFDSIPAIFAITTDPFIVWSSNIFAILGLRALYFVLTGLMLRFELLKYGLAIIIIFVGAKMLVEPWVVVPIGASLGFIASMLLLFSYLSFKQDKKKGR